MYDEYTHVDNKVIYTMENIPGPAEESDDYEKILLDFNSQLTNHCKCNQFCSFPACNCLRQCGGAHYKSYIHNEKLKCELIANLNSPIVECNKLCQCSIYCGNRLVQNGPVGGLFVNNCEMKLKGKGLFTDKFISKGTFVCEYAGEVITKQQALSRHQINLLENNPNYIFCLNEYSNGQMTQTIIDPSVFGNIGRYINHSCEPNCCVIPVRIDTPIPKLAIFSCSDILPNTEITFDYGSNNLHGVEDINNRKICLCNSYNCRKWMPYNTY